MAIAVAFAFLAAIGFSSGYVLIRVGTQRVSAPTATFFGVFTGAVLVAGLAFALNLQEIKSLEPVAFAWFALMGAIAYPVARVLNNTAITMVGASRAAPMSSLQPLFALALAISFLGERPNLMVSLGTPMIVCGLILVVLTGGTNGSSGPVLNARRLGYVLAIGAALSFATRDVISRHVLVSVAPPMVTAAFALTIGGIFLFALTYRDVIKSLRTVPGRYLLVCGLSGICQGVAIAALFQALSRAPVTVVSPINASTPLITLLLVHLFLQRLETISPLLVAGTLLSVTGVAVVVFGALAY